MSLAQLPKGFEFVKLTEVKFSDLKTAEQFIISQNGAAPLCMKTVEVCLPGRDDLPPFNAIEMPTAQFYNVQVDTIVFKVEKRTTNE